MQKLSRPSAPLFSNQGSFYGGPKIANLPKAIARRFLISGPISESNETTPTDTIQGAEQHAKTFMPISTFIFQPWFFLWGA